MSLATLTAEAGPAPVADAVAAVAVDGDGVEVTWAGDGARSLVRFRPMSVSLLE
ncbi:hypothetical protein [Streptomyces chiangmaiensis]|uniref:Uncharacterized protein n=1 Tax=Streptomyces chiangmaiensis TaxID=766497 RepID=A0ABU7FCX0_9ACTN|nr:hypothetical protein [Streptomyces chiangmaiensis]MED7821749.1 hypothetical protein [Streptomyces chiangmaiensis]